MSKVELPRIYVAPVGPSGQDKAVCDVCGPVGEWRWDVRFAMADRQAHEDHHLHLMERLVRIKRGDVPSAAANGHALPPVKVTPKTGRDLARRRRQLRTVPYWARRRA